MTSEVDLFLEFMSQEGDMLKGEPASETDILEFESRYSVRLPADIREFFLKINGSFVHGIFISVEELSEWCLLTEYMRVGHKVM